jgi:hypothetical protein
MHVLLAAAGFGDNPQPFVIHGPVQILWKTVAYLCVTAQSHIQLTEMTKSRTKIFKTLDGKHGIYERDS